MDNSADRNVFGFKSPLGLRFLGYVLISSVTLVILLSATQTYLNYKKEVSRVKHHVLHVEEFLARPLALSAWSMSEPQIRAQLQSVASDPDIVFAKVETDLGEVVSVGTLPEGERYEHRFDLVYESPDRKSNVGRVLLVADLEPVYTRIYSSLVETVFLQAIQTFILSIIVLMIFHKIVGKNLRSFTDQLGKLSLDQKSLEKLPEPQPPDTWQDEFDMMWAKLSGMAHRIQTEFRQRIEMERALFQAEDKLFTALSRLPGFLFQIEFEEDFRNFKVDFLSSGLKRIVGVNPNDAVKDPKKILSLIPASEVQPLSSRIMTAIDQMQPWIQFDLEWQKDSERGYLQFNVDLIRVGDRFRLQGIALDITEVTLTRQNKQNLEAQLLQTQKMEALGTLAGGIAHDFNNILQGVIGAVEVIQHEDLSPKSKQMTEVLLRFAGRGRDIVKKILIFSRQEKQDESIFDLNEVLEDAVMMAETMSRGVVELDFERPEGETKVIAPKSHLYQVIVNLVINALHAVDGVDRPKVSVSTHPVEKNRWPVDLAGERGYQVLISDNGTGIPKEVQARIFDPFFTTKPVGVGTGMGLSMVKSIVEAYGGRVDFHSEVGRGTTFYLFIPDLTTGTNTDTNRTQGLNEASMTSFGRKRILLVDDDQLLMELLQSTLSIFGFDVELCSTPQSLVDNPEQYAHVDIVLTDFSMPESSGVDVAKAIKQKFPTKPVFLISGNFTREDVGSEYFDRIIAKPCLAVDIKREVVDFFAQAQTKNSKPQADQNT